MFQVHLYLKTIRFCWGKTMFWYLKILKTVKTGTTLGWLGWAGLAGLASSWVAGWLQWDNLEWCLARWKVSERNVFVELLQTRLCGTPLRGVPQQPLLIYIYMWRPAKTRNLVPPCAGPVGGGTRFPGTRFPGTRLPAQGFFPKVVFPWLFSSALDSFLIVCHSFLWVSMF